ncbi:hypothetical protein ABZ547_35015 [Streptomyces sparsogenes]|uniref:hypothetical protein n=1 Tax=Streptomyces sparsogenes TaxID=67365 RepID=UPI0033E85F3B
MAEEGESEPESPLWKWLGLTIIVGALGGVLWLIKPYVLDDPFDNTSEVPCSAVASFAGGELPDGASDGHCTERSWTDVQMQGSFRMPRAAVAGWLDSSFPGSRKRDRGPTPSCECDLYLDIQSPPTGAEADAVQITVVYEDSDTAFIHLTAFTV